MYNGKARAYTNIALIKYWGKKDKELILPMNNSLSLTLDAFYTETSVSFSPYHTKDSFVLDGQLQDEKATAKVSRFLDIARKKAGVNDFAQVESQNFVPTAAGLASSASGLAALAGACNDALQLGLSEKELSQLARRGSGSACRSVFGGFVEWEKGHSDDTSYAQVVPSDDWEEELAMIFILINDQQKDVSSRDGMERTVATSDFYDGWLEAVSRDIQTAKQAIAAKDFQALGEVTEANGLKMHATTLAATPPFTYWSPDSLKAMNKIRQIRQTGLACYFTMDAGPNVKVLCQKKDVSAILVALQEDFTKEQLTCAYAGEGLKSLEMEVAK